MKRALPSPRRDILSPPHNRVSPDAVSPLAQRPTALWNEPAAAILFGLASLFSACTSVPTEHPLTFEANSPAAPYTQEVHADRPLAHWRLNGTAKGAIEGDKDRATPFKNGEKKALEGADIGGPEAAFEVWLKDARGTALNYSEPGGKEAFALDLTETLGVRLFGERHDTGVRLDNGRWQHVGVSWRSSDGLMTVAVDGFTELEIKASKGKELPYDGRLVAGGQFAGVLDEAAVFDKTLHASQWLHRSLVARSKAPPSVPDEELPPRLVVQTGHTEIVTSLSWSPDGTMVATASRDETVKLWDTATGSLINILKDNNGGVMNVSWSPDGSRLASAGRNGTAMVWDSTTGALRHQLDAHSIQVNTVSWNPGGTLLATASVDGTVKVWDGFTGNQLHELKEAHSVSWSPDGSRIATASSNATAIIWNAAKGEPLNRLKGHSAKLTSVSWSLDGSRLATSDSDGTTKVWDGQRGTVLLDLHGHEDTVRSVSWSSDGTRLATAGNDNTAKVWNSQTGALIHDLKDHTSAVVSVSWSPEAKRLATASKDKTAKVWDSHTGALLENLEGHTSELTSAAWSTDGIRLATASRDNTAKVWDTNTGALLQDLKGQNSGVWSVSWSTDGTRLATKTTDQRAKVWDASTGALLHDPKEREVSWSQDITKLAMSNGDKRAKLLDLADGALLKAMNSHNSPEWSPDGNRLATADRETAKVWDASTGALLHGLEGHTSFITSLAWNPDGTRLASSSTDKTVKVWDTKNGSILQDIKGHVTEVWGVSWSPDGTKLAYASRARGGWGVGSKVQVRESATGALLHDLEIPKSEVSSFAWSQDGIRIAVAGHGGEVRVSNSQTGILLLDLKAHASSVRSISWHPEGKKLATGSSDGTAKVWDIEKGTCVTLIGTTSSSWLTFTDQNYFDGSANADNLLAIVQGSRAFSFDQLAPTRNRPDKVLETLGAPKSLIDFHELLWLRRLQRLGLSPEEVNEDFSSAPTVRILRSAEPGENGELALSLIFTDRADLKGYRVFVNGVPVSQRIEPLEGTRQRLSVLVQLTAGTNKVEISALNTQGVESLRARTMIEHDGKGLPEPKLYFLGFGVSDYADDQLDLNFAHQDVLDLEAALSAKRGDFEEVRTLTFTDAQVTEEALEKSHAFLHRITEHDTLVMFIAGHGVRGSDKARTYYYLDHDTELSNLEDTAIPFDKMEALLYESRARKKLFLLDTCQSGEDIDIGTLTAQLEGVRGLKARSLRGSKVFGAMSLVPHDTEQGHVEDQRIAQMWLDTLRDKNRLIMQDLSRRSGAIVLASSLGQESSLETGTWANGAFTEELLQALQSQVADTNKDGKVDVQELSAHVITAVPKLTGGRQHPNVERDNPLQRFALPISTR